MCITEQTRQLDKWQAAIEAILRAAEAPGPLMHARIGVMRALNRNSLLVFHPEQWVI
jgi:hypothetical protein